MAALTANWVKESTATTGTGTINLGGAETGFIAFSDTFSTADTVHYVIEDGNNKEYGIGTLTTGAPWTLARTTVLETLVSGTFDDTSPTAITLSGSATVGVAAIADPPGTIVGSARTEYTSLANPTTAIPADTTIPQNTEGDELFTVSYTPKYADSILEVIVHLARVRAPGSVHVTAALFRDSTADALASTAIYDSITDMTIFHLDEPANSTASTTFKVRVGPSSGTGTYVNGTTSSQMHGVAMNTFIEVREIRQ